MKQEVTIDEPTVEFMQCQCGRRAPVTTFQIVEKTSQYYTSYMFSTIAGPIQWDFTLNGPASCRWMGALVPYELDIEREC